MRLGFFKKTVGFTEQTRNQQERAPGCLTAVDGTHTDSALMGIRGGRSHGRKSGSFQVLTVTLEVLEMSVMCHLDPHAEHLA